MGIFPCQVKDIIFVWRVAHEVRLNPHKVRLKQTSENSKTHKQGGGGILDFRSLVTKLNLDLHKSGNGLCLDLHKSSHELSLTCTSLVMNLFGLGQSGNELGLHKSSYELSLDLHKSGYKFSLDLHKSGNE